MQTDHTKSIKILLYVDTVLLVILTIMGSYCLFAFTPTIIVNDESNRTQSRDIEAELNALKPVDYVSPTQAEVEAQLNALSADTYVAPTDAELEAELDALKPVQ